MQKIALIGRPNVGKSTLFNRLIRSRRAITHDRPGVTRDRMEGVALRRGNPPFIIIDTGGITLDGVRGDETRLAQGPEGIRGFEAEILRQAEAAMAESAGIVLVVDGLDGLTPFDEHLAKFVRRTGKPALLAVNKIDGPELADARLAEFYPLGFDPVPVSAAHGYNLGGLYESLLRLAGLFADEEGQGAEAAENEAAGPDAPDIPAASAGPAAPGIQDTEDGDAAQEEQAADAGPDEEFFPADYSAPAGEWEDDAGPAGGAGLADDAGEADDAPGCPGSPGADEAALTNDADFAEDEAGSAPGRSGPGRSEPGRADLRLAMLGRPNAGKSSLVNALAGEERMIVSDVPGTTRDSVDVRVELADGPDAGVYVFVDTAGVRRRTKITDAVEIFSVNSAIKSSTKADVTLLVIDGDGGLAVQDKRLLALLSERKTPFMVLVNKVDLLKGRDGEAARREIAEALSFSPHVPVLYVSARTGRGLEQVLPMARAIYKECSLRVPTGQLNRAMQQVIDRKQPPVVKRVRPKFFYLTQAEVAPPTFVFFVSDADRIKEPYARYLEKSLRRLFGIRHAPVRVHFRSSHKKDDG